MAVSLPGAAVGRDRASYRGFGASLAGQYGHFQFIGDGGFTGAQGAAGLVVLLVPMDASAELPVL